MRVVNLQIADLNQTAVSHSNTLAAYEADKLRAAQRNIHVITSVASVVNFLLIISDLIFI